MTAPFAFALGALIMKYPGEKWIHITRRWTMVAWLFLTCGIFLGAHWAYAVLGWGGYWGWDPVENASILPWLTMTAFLHSVMMQEKRGMMKMWNMWLIFTTFLLAIFGTFLTRSGVVSSVHAFAQSGIGIWFVWFLAIAFATCVYFFVRNRETLKSEHRLDSLISRESSFLFNNLVLLVACFAVLWGTLFPVLSEWVTGSKVTVGPPFFNRVNVPIGLFLVFLTGVGPLLAWRQTSWDSLRRNFLWPTIVAVADGHCADRRRHAAVARQRVLLFADGDLALSALVAGDDRRRVLARRPGHCATAAHQRSRRHGADHPAQHPALRRIHRALRHHPDRDWLRRPAVQSGQRAGNGLRRQDADRRLTRWCASRTRRTTRRTTAASGPCSMCTRTARRSTPCIRSGVSTRPASRLSTIVANRSRLNEDLYLVYTGKNPDTGKPIIKAHVNPLVMWIWIGVVVVGFGTVLALIPNAKPAKVHVAKKERAEAEAAVKRARWKWEETDGNCQFRWSRQPQIRGLAPVRHVLVTELGSS